MFDTAAGHTRKLASLCIVHTNKFASRSLFWERICYSSRSWSADLILFLTWCSTGIYLEAIQFLLFFCCDLATSVFFFREILPLLLELKLDGQKKPRISCTDRKGPQSAGRTEKAGRTDTDTHWLDRVAINTLNKPCDERTKRATYLRTKGRNTSRII